MFITIVTGNLYDFDKILATAQEAVAIFLKVFGYKQPDSDNASSDKESRDDTSPDNVSKVLRTFTALWLETREYDDVSNRCIAVETEVYRLDTYLMRDDGPAIYIGLSQNVQAFNPAGLTDECVRQTIAALHGLGLKITDGYHPLNMNQRVVIGEFPHENFGNGVGPYCRRGN